MRDAHYARVSDRKQAEKEVPISDQLAECRKRSERDAAIIGGTYLDEGISGRLGPKARGGLRDLLAAAGRGEFDRVIVWKSNRLARDENLAGKIAWDLQEAGVEIISCLHEAASPIERMFRRFQDAEYARGVREDVTRAMLSKASRREYTGGTETYGYRWKGTAHSGKPRVEREIVPSEAARVRRAFELADPAGPALSLVDIGRDVGWSRQRVRRTLRHPVYAGGYVYGRQKYNGRVGSMRPRSSWKIQWDAHDPIVDRKLFDRVQQRLDRNSENWRFENHGRSSLALTGLMKCGACGQPMRLVGKHTSKKDGVIYYYACDGALPKARTQRRRQQARPCDTENVPVLGLVERILLLILEEWMKPEVAKRFAEELNRAYRAGVKEGNLEAQVRQLEQAEANLVDVMTSGKITDTTRLAEKYEEIRRDLKVATAALKKQRSTGQKLLRAKDVRARIAPICADIRELVSIPGLEKAARPLLHQYVRTITISPDRTTAYVEMRWSAVLPAELSHLVGGRGVRNIGATLPPLRLNATAA